MESLMVPMIPVIITGIMAPKPDLFLMLTSKYLTELLRVNMLDPKKSQQPNKTFQEYSTLVFFSLQGHLLQDIVRVDVVWDTKMPA